MRITNESIEMIAVFRKDKKDIIPYKFRYKNTPIKIQQISKIYEEKLAGNKRIVFVCIHNSKDIYKIKYEVDTLKWFLFKK